MTSRKHRYFLIFVIACIMIFQIFQVRNVLNIQSLFPDAVSLSVPLELVATTFWLIVLTVVTIQLVQNRRYAIRYAYGACLGYSLYFLARFAIFAQSDYARQRLPFLTFIVVILFFVVGIGGFITYWRNTRTKGQYTYDESGKD